MVKSDGKLTSINFDQTEKNPSAADGHPDGKRTKEKTGQLGRFSCGVEVRFLGNDMFDVRKVRNTA